MMKDKKCYTPSAGILSSYSSAGTITCITSNQRAGH